MLLQFYLTAAFIFRLPLTVQKEEEEERRRDKIRKIQAASLVSHKVREKYNPYALKEQGLSCEMSDSEVFNPLDFSYGYCNILSYRELFS